MTTNQTIDGVPRDLLERIMHGCMFSLSRQQYDELRALLDAPACKTCCDQGEIFVSKGKVESHMLTEPENIYRECPDCKPASQPKGEPVAYRIGVNGEWFYGDKLSCVRERVEYESTFTKEDFEEAGVVTPEPLYANPPAPVAPTPINYGALDPVERLAVCRGEQVRMCDCNQGRMPCNGKCAPASTI